MQQMLGHTGAHASIWCPLMPAARPAPAGARRWTALTIALDMRGRIYAGEWDPGDRLPSTRDLMDEYGSIDAEGADVRPAPSATIQGAITHLRRSGLVESRERSARTVADPLPPPPATPEALSDLRAEVEALSGLRAEVAELRRRVDGLEARCP